ncbi:hypothetical protein SAMN02910356_01240 [Selenomonas sp. GACV-9]|uniref:LPP20 family lipoprotein n=1 Tax=Selenomonas sp. GACV-9 TaxID=3158782 RepID=UPI0008EE0DC3|nr:hypothetical protein SAMN02910356_01240 [Selenomonas ruminantium]
MMRVSRLLATLVAMTAIMVFSMATVFAAANDNVDWDNSVIRATGGGVAPSRARTQAQARMMARRAAIVDAYRQLAEYVGGVNIDGETTVNMAEVTSDVIRTRVNATIRGARIIKEGVTSDGGYEVTMEVPLFGVSASVASAVMERPATVEAFPEPVPSVEPAAPSSVHIDINVGTGTTTPSVDTGTTGSAASSKGSSAASAPSGRAIGGYTGLIVDCRGLDLKPVMSPVIKNESGQPIYGYKNLDYDKVVSNGMVGYTRDINRAGRAGSNPLVVRAIALDNHNGNPILATADANRVLIENGATHFLDATNVVFLR